MGQTVQLLILLERDERTKDLFIRTYINGMNGPKMYTQAQKSLDRALKIIDDFKRSDAIAFIGEKMSDKVQVGKFAQIYRLDLEAQVVVFFKFDTVLSKYYSELKGYANNVFINVRNHHFELSQARDTVMRFNQDAARSFINIAA